MAVIQVGDNGTLRSRTAEGQLQEICAYLEIGETTVSLNSSGIDNVVVTHFQNSATFTANFTIPVKQFINPGGQVVYAADDYLETLAFLPGQNGTFKSITCAGYFVELVIYMQNLERNPTTNPQNKNYITGTFNSDSTIFSGAINLPIELSIDERGRVVYTAKEYLTTQ